MFRDHGGREDHGTWLWREFRGRAGSWCQTWRGVSRAAFLDAGCFPPVPQGDPAPALWVWPGHAWDEPDKPQTGRIR